jgi:DNA-binding transcriptional MerR regulator
MRDKFSTLDIVKALSIPRERLRDWMNNGFVVPTTRSEGQGTKAIFTRDDIYLVALFVDLRKKGFKRDGASDLIRKTSEVLRKNGSESLAYIIIYFLNNRNNAILAEPIYDPVTRWDRIDLRWGGRIPPKLIERSKKHAIGSNDLLTEESAMKKLSTTQEWENIHLVNFKNLKKKVDIDLSLFG